MYGAKSEGSYVTLPSNASADVFKDNKTSSFRVDLAQHIDLEGPWEVALTDISYHHTWYTINKDDSYFYWRKKNEIHRQSFKEGFYGAVKDFKVMMEKSYRSLDSDIYIDYDEIQKKFDFQAVNETHVFYEGPAAYMMGLKLGEWYKFAQKIKETDYPVNLKAGFYHLYCYSDVVRLQLVGDVYAPLLRTIGVQGMFGEIITQHFNLGYLPVAKQHIENIKIEIKTDPNKPVDFIYGKSIVTLHFRPKV